MAATKRTAAERIRVYGEFFPDIPFDAVIRHPLADEHDWLRAHHMRPEDCWGVDLYWALGDLAAFVEIYAVRIYPAGARNPCVTYRFRAGGTAPHCFYVGTEAAPITSKIVVEALNWLSTWIAGHRDEMRKYRHLRSEKPLYISKVDIISITHRGGRSAG